MWFQRWVKRFGVHRKNGSDAARKMDRKPTRWQEISANHLSKKESASRIYKKFQTEQQKIKIKIKIKIK